MLYRYVPREIVERPKRGFGAPVQVWLRGDLRGWAESLLSRAALGRHGLLNVEACRRVWENFAHHGGGWNPMIWNLLMFQASHERTSQVAAMPRRVAPSTPQSTPLGTPRLAATA